MKSVIATGVLGIFLLGSALAAETVKFTFPEQMYPDGRVGTIQAGVKTTRKSTVTVCDYYSDPNDGYLGEFQGNDFASSNANEVRDYCLQHYNDRQLPK